ncbi:MAG: hypothetical protein JNK04_21070, partial [Myxococcales bacterium]|nr:hypothetical protein [Myxococcales bacterium]
LCAASAQYAQPKYGFDKDAALVERHFSGRTTVERALTSERLMDLLTTEHYDIIHMVVRVNPENGELCFPDLHDEVGSDTDVVSPRALRALLEESRTRLVVLATCNALLTAVEVAPVANMAASFTEIVDDIAVGWADRFYRLLVQGKSVWKAFDLANEQRETTIRTIRQKDVRFKLR